MKRKTLTLGLLLTVAVVFVVSHIAATATAQPERRLLRRAGVPLAQQLKAGDRTVTVVDETSPPLEVLPPAGMSDAEWMTYLSRLVFVVQVRQLRSSTTPEGDFIETTVTAEIEEIVKQPGDEFRPGSTIRFTLPGGVLTVNGVNVKGEVPWSRQAQKGSRYVVFTKVGDAGELVVGPTSLYQVDGEGPAKRLADSQHLPEVQGVPAQAFLNDLRAAVVAKKQP